VIWSFSVWLSDKILVGFSLACIKKMHVVYEQKNYVKIMIFLVQFEFYFGCCGEFLYIQLIMLLTVKNLILDEAL